VSPCVTKLQVIFFMHHSLKTVFLVSKFVTIRQNSLFCEYKVKSALNFYSTPQWLECTWIAATLNQSMQSKIIPSNNFKMNILYIKGKVRLSVCVPFMQIRSFKPTDPKFCIASSFDHGVVMVHIATHNG
jgi:hypothetical protein